jgi:hypothetical protein
MPEEILLKNVAANKLFLNFFQKFCQVSEIKQMTKKKII